MDNPNQNCVLIFVKNPNEGSVKTRLAEKLGAAAAVNLYKNFVLDTISTIDTLDVLVGRIPPRGMRLVTEWAQLHQNELRENWSRVQQGQPFLSIEPLA